MTKENRSKSFDKYPKEDKEKHKDNKKNFITEYSEEYNSFCKIIKKYLPILYNDNRLVETFPWQH